MVGLEWKTEYKKETDEFGIFNLVIKCVVEDKVSVTDLIDLHLKNFEDDILSVKIASLHDDI